MRATISKFLFGSKSYTGKCPHGNHKIKATVTNDIAYTTAIIEKQKGWLMDVYEFYGKEDMRVYDSDGCVINP